MAEASPLPGGRTLPRVSVLCHDLSSNALGRSLVLAGLLREHTLVDILGVSSRPGVWGPASATDLPIEAGPLVQNTSDLAAARRWLEETGEGEVLLVSKAMPTSLGLALDADLRGRKLALDIDDWEYGLCLGSERRPVAHALAFAAGPLLRHRPNHAARIRRLERRVHEIPHRLVSNTWLQDRFGGTVLYHVRDHEALDPARVDATVLRAELGLDTDRTWVGFIGTWRPYKGIDDLVAALQHSEGTTKPGLLLAGVDIRQPDMQRTVRTAWEVLGPDRLRVAGPFSMAELPAHVCAPDIIAIPSKSGPATQGQIPAKLFDAMALARPIVATAVCDVPTILDGCGRIVAPEDPNALAGAIDELAADGNLRQRLGLAARARLIAGYSVDAGRRTMLDFIGGLRGGLRG